MIKENNKNPRIGIIGKGFVGSAVAQGFSSQTGYDSDLKIYDKDPSRSINSLDETINESDFIFLSLPTPSKKNGSIDLSIIEKSLEEINKINKNTNNILLLRSTVVPGTTRKLQDRFKNINFVFNPEFLTERSANFDFINQSRIILGGEDSSLDRVEKLYQDRFGPIPVLKTNFETAEMIKYMNNLFFATKVSFLNEMKLLSDKVGANWQDAVDGFILDGRIGHSHLAVPGPDGKLGFGGSCFPKDIQALITFAKENNVEMSVLKGAWETNLRVRPERDWEQLKGRAVSSDENE